MEDSPTKAIISIAPSRSSSIALALLFTLMLSVSVLALLFFMDLAANYAKNIKDTNDLHPILHNSQLILILGWGVAGLLFLLAIGGFYIADRVVYRINTIANTANNIIQTGDLSRRIPFFGNWDDLSKLADILNQLFAQVEHLMEEVRQVSDMVAHDLRTPLTRLKNNLEMLHDKSEAEQLGVEEDTEKLIAEADHLLATFSALLRIRTIESGKWRGDFEQVKLSKIVEDVGEYYEPLILEKHQILHMNIQPVEINGDCHLLFQAIANMLDNAVKYAPEAGVIYIELSKHENITTLIVKNTGSSVAQENLSKIFGRFYRTDKARSSNQGNGLGLSLVKAVVKMHHGEIIAYNEDDAFCLSCKFTKIM